MPFAFIIVGLALLISGVRGRANQLLSLVKADFTGSGNFIYWTASILVIGALGYIQSLRPISRAFLILILCVLILKNGGFFSLFSQALKSVNGEGDTTIDQADFQNGFGGTSGGAGASGSW